MHKLILILIAVHFVLSVVGQQSDYFKNLLDELPDPELVRENVTPVRAYLPAGFTYFPSQGFVGISDPMMTDTLKAFQQAYLRAVMMYALREGRGKGLTDFYTDERDGEVASVYQEFVLLNSRSSFNAGAFDVQSYQLGSGEFVVVLNPRFESESGSESGSKSESGSESSLLQFTTRVEFYSKEVVSEGADQSFSKLTIQQQLRDSSTGVQNQEIVEYQFTNSSRIALRSNFNGTTFEPGAYRYFYHKSDLDSTHTTDSIQPKGALTLQGMWFAVMADLFGQVTSQFQSLSSNISRVGDQYESLALSLNRETGEFSFRLKIGRWDFHSNKLRLTLDY